MKSFISIVLTAVIAAAMAACEGGYTDKASNVSNSSSVNTINSNAAKPVAAAPTAASLLVLENKAAEAWGKNDAKFFEGLLSENFASFHGGQRFTKADELKMVSEMKCDIKSISLTEEKVTPVGPDAAVLTTKSIIDGSCGGEKIPSPTRAASLYVRSGSEWKAAYHSETPIVEGSSAAPATAPPTAKKEDAKPSADAKPADALTETLMAIEKKGWDGWRTQNAAMLQETTTTNLGFVDPSGRWTSPQADVIKLWTTGKCEIKSAGPADGVATSITPTVAVLTFKGNADGTCDGEKLMNLWGTSIYLKDGDTWKAAYIFESPA